MVGATPKPFACTSEGCTMTFTNEDHLNIHQKKHEMVLNLGLGTKHNNIVADQTPTPTRFLRNCEEVGLFQDLQNVNPFEETFRRAVELVKTGSLPEPDLPEDDTLHTPHVFPHLPEENVGNIYVNQHEIKNKISLNSDNISRSIDLSIDTPQIISKDDEHSSSSSEQSVNAENSNKRNVLNPPSIIVSSDQSNIITDKSILTIESTIESNHLSVIDYRRKQKSILDTKNPKNLKTDNSSATKLKLQQALLKNKNQAKIAEKTKLVPQQIFIKNIIQSNIPAVSVVNNVLPVYQAVHPILPKIETITLPLNGNSVFFTKKTKTVSVEKTKNVAEDKKRTELLERNRAAAVRCREKKKMRVEKLGYKYENVCKMNSDLQDEVTRLKNEVVHLKTLLLAHSECPVTKAMSMGQNIPIGPAQIVSAIVQVPIVNKPETSDDSLKKPPKKPKLSTNNKNKSVIVLNDSYNELHE